MPCIDYVTEGLDDSRKQTPLNTVIRQTGLNMIVQFCHVFDAMFPISFTDEEYSDEIIECGSIEVKMMLYFQMTILNNVFFSFAMIVFNFNWADSVYTIQ